MLEVASACHGCGSCRTLEPALRMCPSFRSLADGGGLAPRPGQPDPPGRHRRGRSPALGQRRAEGARRPLHPLQALPAGVPLGGRRLQPDGGGQGGLCREARPAAERLGLLAAGDVGAAGQPVPDRHELPPDASMGAADPGAAPGRLEAPGAAARPADAVHPTRRAAGPRQAPPAAARPAGRLLRRRLRQLLRPGAGRGGRLGPPPRRA